MAPGRRDALAREIIGFLKHCKASHAPATVELAKQYLSTVEDRAPGPTREALRWFFVHGRKRGHSRGEGLAHAPGAAAASGSSESGGRIEWQRPRQQRVLHPPPASGDLGETTWEQALIKSTRERGFLWRTEQTYREWAVRFARFLMPRSPYAATGDDVAAFLSALAVKGRASPSAQKQALNALVFLMQEALHRELGKLSFQRAFPKRRLPTVLSVNECKSLFAQMEGTARLMAELAYGSGLRLLELLRLRIHHVELERLRVRVISGKGDKDRMTVLPERLAEELRYQFSRLRTLWEADRVAGAPGVWLPDGLARKYPKAGTSWEWQWVFVTCGHPCAALRGQALTQAAA